MTDLQEQILDAVRIAIDKNGGPCKAHTHYLPEVLALVACGKLRLVESRQDVLLVDWPK